MAISFRNVTTSECSSAHSCNLCRCTTGSQVSSSAGQSSMTSMHWCASWQGHTQLRVSWKGELGLGQINKYLQVQQWACSTNMVLETCKEFTLSACMQVGLHGDLCTKHKLQSTEPWVCHSSRSSTQGQVSELEFLLSWLNTYNRRVH